MIDAETTGGHEPPVARLLRRAALLALHAHHVAAATGGQRDAVEQIRALSEELLASADEVAGAAARAADGARASHAAAVEGGAEVAAMVGRLSAAGEAATALDQIAARTKLLALNATIEAARAGEHGAGFKVVAEEVGRLATQSAEAVASVNAILAETGADVQAARRRFAAIEAQAAELDGVAAGVAAAAAQQAQALGHLDAAVDQVVVGAGAVQESAAALDGSVTDVEAAGGHLAAALIVGEHGEEAAPAAEALRRVHAALTPVIDVPRRHAGHLLALARRVAAGGGALRSTDLAALDDLLRASLVAHDGLLANVALSIVPGRLADRSHHIQVWASDPAAEPFAIETQLDPALPDFYDYPSQDWFRLPIADGRPWTSDPYFDAGGSDLHVVTVATPVLDADGPLAVSSADLDVARLARLAAPALEVLPGAAVLVAANDVVLATNRPDRFAPGAPPDLGARDGWRAIDGGALGWTLLLGDG